MARWLLAHTDGWVHLCCNSSTSALTPSWHVILIKHLWGEVFILFICLHGLLFLCFVLFIICMAASCNEVGQWSSYVNISSPEHLEGRVSSSLCATFLLDDFNHKLCRQTLSTLSYMVAQSCGESPRGGEGKSTWLLMMIFTVHCLLNYLNGITCHRHILWNIYHVYYWLSLVSYECHNNIIYLGY